jgi:quercetin dioxygenase-like cupin family protein
VPPNTHVAPHWHPGEEYQYVLEGEATVKIEGQPDFEIREGMAGRIPYKAVHSVMTKDKGIKVVVFRIHTSGKPVRFAKGEKGSS